jgi:hypothetical protein
MEIVDRLLAVLGALSLPVKMAWGVWLVWGLGQLTWFLWPRGGSRVRAVQIRSSSVRPVAVRPPSRKEMATAPGAAAYGTSDFIAALDEEQAAAAESLVSDHSSSYR